MNLKPARMHNETLSLKKRMKEMKEGRKEKKLSTVLCVCSFTTWKAEVGE
jgi:hypothetical protein